MLASKIATRLAATVARPAVRDSSRLTTPVSAAPRQGPRRQQARAVNTGSDDLGGPYGSNPPSPKKNKYNWIAGSITAVVALVAGFEIAMKARKKGNDTEAHR